MKTITINNRTFVINKISDIVVNGIYTDIIMVHGGVYQFNCLTLNDAKELRDKIITDIENV